MRENLIEETGINEHGDRGRRMSIDCFCVVQGIEINQPNTEVIGVYINKENNELYDAEILLNGIKHEIIGIRVDDTSIYFKTDIFEDKN